MQRDSVDKGRGAESLVRGVAEASTEEAAEDVVGIEVEKDRGVEGEENAAELAARP